MIFTQKVANKNHPSIRKKYGYKLYIASRQHLPNLFRQLCKNGSLNCHNILQDTVFVIVRFMSKSDSGQWTLVKINLGDKLLNLANYGQFFVIFHKKTDVYWTKWMKPVVHVWVQFILHLECDKLFSLFIYLQYYFYPNHHVL